MKKYLLISLLSAFISLCAQTEKGLRGIVRDPVGATVPGASVILMEQKDSTLSAFTSTNAEGIFEIRKLSKGKYILQISSLGLQTHYQNLEWTGDAELRDLGTIELKNKINQLKEVDVSADHIPIKIKNDTIEYNAKAFKTQPNAVVEDLLKKLPGVEVDKDGTVKAQGKQVNKILVDGKEFFGDDPKMATKNLPADAVKNVQVFDKKSDAAEFTGIDDGQRDKTINLKLKDDKKQGLFGKISAGGGTSDRYEVRGNINNFNKETQASLVGMSNNTNTQGFTINDYINFMGGLKNMMGSGEGGRISINAKDIGLPLGSSNSNDGFTNTNAGGLNYNRELSKKTELRSSYFLNIINKDAENEIFRQNIVNKQTYNTNENNINHFSNQSQRLNLILKHKIDSTQQLIWRTNIGRLTEKNNLQLSSQSFYPDGFQQNGENTFNQSDNAANKFNTSLNYLKKLNRKGRNFATTLSLGNTDGDNNTFVNSIRAFYTQQGNTRYDSLNQRQDLQSHQLTYSGKISYTEPLGKRRYLEMSYMHQVSDNRMEKKYFDIHAGRSSEVLNTTLSNDFNDLYQYDRIGTNLKFTPSKQTIIAGLAYQGAALRTEQSGNVLRKKYLNFLPNASWLVELGTGKQLQTFYQTSINAPSGEQLQPVINNTNPLNLYQGNPDLQPEYKHVLNLSYSSFDQFSFTSFFMAVDGDYTKNKISSQRSIDKNLVQLTKPINVDNDITTNGYWMFSTPLRFIKSKINLSFSSLYNRSILFIDTTRNNVNRYVNTIDINLENFRKEVIDAQIGVKLSHNLSGYSISSSQNQNFLNRVYYVAITAFTGKNWTLNAELDYSVYQGNVFGGVREVPILKASVSKQFLKNNRGELKLSAIDLLNRNVGINRTSSFNYIQDEHVQTLGRYFLLSFTYSLSKFAGKNAFDIRMKEH